MTAQIKEPMTESTNTHGNRTWELGVSRADQFKAGRFSQGSHKTASAEPMAVVPSKNI